jgi:hypothetical protein
MFKVILYVKTVASGFEKAESNTPGPKAVPRGRGLSTGIEKIRLFTGLRKCPSPLLYN